MLKNISDIYKHHCGFIRACLQLEFYMPDLYLDRVDRAVVERINFKMNKSIANSIYVHGSLLYARRSSPR